MQNNQKKAKTPTFYFVFLLQLNTRFIIKKYSNDKVKCKYQQNSYFT
jgi:hypothetical protein